MRKSVAALSLIVLSAVLLAACGSSSTTTQTVTVPDGKLSATAQGTPTTPETTPSTDVYIGNYMGGSEGGKDVRFRTAANPDRIVNLYVDDKVIASNVYIKNKTFKLIIGAKTYEGTWEWDTFVSGTFASRDSSGHTTKDKWEANAYSF